MSSLDRIEEASRGAADGVGNPAATTAVLLDALPYADAAVHEDYEQYALALVEEEVEQRGPSSARQPAVDSNTFQFRRSDWGQEYQLYLAAPTPLTLGTGVNIETSVDMTLSKLPAPLT
ncbi:hypothetical protein ACA910_017524 [Epithemia clementina (nom. ined.)]